MCGRAKLPDDVSEIKLDLKIDFDGLGDYRPRWNAAPTSHLPVVVSKDGERTLTGMRWGLVPLLGQEHQSRPLDFQRRAEDIETRPAFRGAWKANRRCLVIADGYYEWRATDKQPFAVAPGNRGPMTFAGLWISGTIQRRPTARRSDHSPSSPLNPTRCLNPCTTTCRRCSLPIAGPPGSANAPSPRPNSKQCSRLIPATPWRIGRSTVGWAMSATTVRIYFARLSELPPDGGVIAETPSARVRPPE